MSGRPGLKIAVTGKGGVGKTTLSALLAALYAEDGYKVLAVDADPDANLGAALGFSTEELCGITPISAQKGLIAERTGAEPGGFGKFFKINPKVDDIPERFAIGRDGLKLLVMGTVDTGGGGCICPEHVILKNLMSHLIIDANEVVIMDMEAGLEHLGRGTAGMMDAFLVVLEPGERSVQTYDRIRELAADLGIKQVKAVGNKIRNAEDENFISRRVPESDLVGFLPYSDQIMEADRAGMSPYEPGSPATLAAIGIKERINHEKTV